MFDVISKSLLREQMHAKHEQATEMERLLTEMEYLQGLDYYASRMLLHDWRDVRRAAIEQLQERYDKLVEKE